MLICVCEAAADELGVADGPNVEEDEEEAGAGVAGEELDVDPVTAVEENWADVSAHEGVELPICGNSSVCGGIGVMAGSVIVSAGGGEGVVGGVGTGALVGACDGATIVGTGMLTGCGAAAGAFFFVLSIAARIARVGSTASPDQRAACLNLDHGEDSNFASGLSLSSAARIDISWSFS